MSPIKTLVFDIFPFVANALTCLMSSVLSITLANPCSVPPPIPIPPICRIPCSSHCTRDVPVPMLTTIILFSCASCFAPRPSAINSCALLVGSPYIEFSI